MSWKPPPASPQPLRAPPQPHGRPPCRDQLAAFARRLRHPRATGRANCTVLATSRPFHAPTHFKPTHTNTCEADEETGDSEAEEPARWSAGQSSRGLPLAPHVSLPLGGSHWHLRVSYFEDCSRSVFRGRSVHVAGGLKFFVCAPVSVCEHVCRMYYT